MLMALMLIFFLKSATATSEKFILMFAEIISISVSRPMNTLCLSLRVVGDVARIFMVFEARISFFSFFFRLTRRSSRRKCSHTV